MKYTEDDIERVASALLTGFIPKDPEEKQLVFHFTLPPNSYKVTYSKNQKGVWEYMGSEESDPRGQ